MATGHDWLETAPAGRVISARAGASALRDRQRTDADLANLVTRRALLRTAFWSGASVAGAGLLVGIVNYIWPRGIRIVSVPVTVPAARVPRPGDEPFWVQDGRFYLVNLAPGTGVPSAYQTYAKPSQKGGLLALWQKCPHLGCTVPWRSDFVFKENPGEGGWFRCPCHGSTYTKAGVKVDGPAPRSMDTMELKLNRDGSVTVETGKIRRGGVDNPQVAVLG